MGYEKNPLPYTLKKPKKPLIQKIAGPVTGLLLSFLLIQFFFAKSDHQLMEELVEKNAWASLVHLSAVLRLCQAGVEKACEILDDPRVKNGYIAGISKEKTNVSLADLFAGRHNEKKISELLYTTLKDKYPDLDAIFNAGMSEIKDQGWNEIAVVSCIEELKWILLEHGYDPTDWIER